MFAFIYRGLKGAIKKINDNVGLRIKLKNGYIAFKALLEKDIEGIFFLFGWKILNLCDKVKFGTDILGSNRIFCRDTIYIKLKNDTK